MNIKLKWYWEILFRTLLLSTDHLPIDLWEGNKLKRKTNYLIFMKVSASNPSVIEETNLEEAPVPPLGRSRSPELFSSQCSKGTPDPNDKDKRTRTQTKWSPGSGLFQCMGSWNVPS